MLGINHDFLPHMGDGIEMFDELWYRRSNITVIKCWIKSQWLHPIQVQECRNLIEDLSVTFNDLNVEAKTMPVPINATEVTGISKDLSVIQTLNGSENI